MLRVLVSECQPPKLLFVYTFHIFIQNYLYKKELKCYEEHRLLRLIRYRCDKNGSGHRILRFTQRVIVSLKFQYYVPEANSIIRRTELFKEN